MANIKSQIKRIKTNEKARLANASFKSSMRTAMKAVEAACKANDKETATKLLPVAFSKIDQSLVSSPLSVSIIFFFLNLLKKLN